MKVTPRVAAIVGGVGGSFLAFGVLMTWKKLVELDPYVANVMRAAEGSTQARNEMAARAAAVTRNLEQLANEHTERLAQRTAEQYLADAYGLTAARIAAMQRVATMLGL